MQEMTEVTPWMNEAFFRRRGFVKSSNGWQANLACGFFRGVNLATIIVYDTDSYLGVNIEVRVGDELVGSGYWHSEEDFNKEFRLA